MRRANDSTTCSNTAALALLLSGGTDILYDPMPEVCGYMAICPWPPGCWWLGVPGEGYAGGD